MADQLQGLECRTARLKEAVETLAETHGAWKEQQQHLNERRMPSTPSKRSCRHAFGEERRARDEAEAAVAETASGLQQARWELERLREERNTLWRKCAVVRCGWRNLIQTLPDPPSRDQ